MHDKKHGKKPSLSDYFRDRMVELRNDRGLTQEQIADILEVKKLQVFRYEKGQARVDLSLVEKIADILGVPAETMLVQAPTVDQAHAIALILQLPEPLAKKLCPVIVGMINATLGIGK